MNTERTRYILERCKVIELTIMYLHPLWKNSTDEIFRKACYMEIHDDIFKIPFLKKQWSGKFSEAVLQDPTQYLSKDHDIKRKILAESIFINFDKYGFNGDGTTFLKIVEDLTFSYVTKYENTSSYDENKINKVEAKTIEPEKILKYNDLANKKGWFKTRKIETQEQINKISLNLKYETEEQFFHWIN